MKQKLTLFGNILYTENLERSSAGVHVSPFCQIILQKGVASKHISPNLKPSYSHGLRLPLGYFNP